MRWVPRTKTLRYPLQRHTIIEGSFFKARCKSENSGLRVSTHETLRPAEPLLQFCPTNEPDLRSKSCEFKSWQEQQENFFLQSQLYVLTFNRCLFHPCVTVVAHKRPWSFCPKCRWLVTPKHAYALDPASEWADYVAVQA